MSGTATDQLSPRARPTFSVDSARDAARPLAARWEPVLIVAGVAAAALTILATLRAGFLAYPGWLAAPAGRVLPEPEGT